MTRSNKVALQLLAGGLFGALIGPGLAHLVISFDLPIGGVNLKPGGVVLAAVGGVYSLMGLFVLFGVVWPRLGAVILNVADEEDLRERRTILLVSALTCIALGVAMVVLPFAGPGGPVRTGIAAIVMIGALGLAGYLTWISIRDRHYDELWSHLSAQASAITLAMLASLMVVWGTLAYLGMASPLDPLMIVAAPPGLFLLASFIATGRKGMLTQP